MADLASISSHENANKIFQQEFQPKHFVEQVVSIKIFIKFCSIEVIINPEIAQEIKISAQIKPIHHVYSEIKTN